MSIGLALSGGGAKGMAHIGVIKALTSNGIKIDYIAGTSSGSIIASLFAAGYSPEEMLKIVNKYKKNIIDIDNKSNLNILSSLINKKVNIRGFIKGDNLEKLIRNALQCKNINDISSVKMPIAIPTVSLLTGETVYFWNRENIVNDDEMFLNKGDVASIVRASSSVPGIFIPKKIDDIYYIDGGVKVNTPVSVLKKMGADKIIAVTFEDNNRKKFGIQNVVGIPQKSFYNMCNVTDIYQENMADVNIKLYIKSTSLFNLSNSTYFANRGYNIVCKNIEKIKQMINQN